MAAGPVSLDRTPSQPPNVAGQMGGGGASPAASGIANIIAAIRAKAQQNGAQPGLPPQAMPQPPAASGDNAGFQASADLIEKTLNEMARMKPSFATWGNRMMSLLRAGVAEAIAVPASGQQPPADSEPAGGSASAPGNATPPAGELSRGFSG